MNYMLNFNVCEISPLLLENVALRMGNLQVIKVSCWFAVVSGYLSLCP